MSTAPPPPPPTPSLYNCETSQSMSRRWWQLWHHDKPEILRLFSGKSEISGRVAHVWNIVVTWNDTSHAEEAGFRQTSPMIPTGTRSWNYNGWRSLRSHASSSLPDLEAEDLKNCTWKIQTEWKRQGTSPDLFSTLRIESAFLAADGMCLWLILHTPRDQVQRLKISELFITGDEMLLKSIK